MQRFLATIVGYTAGLVVTVFAAVAVFGGLGLRPSIWVTVGLFALWGAVGRGLSMWLSGDVATRPSPLISEADARNAERRARSRAGGIASRREAPVERYAWAAPRSEAVQEERPPYAGASPWGGLDGPSDAVEGRLRCRPLGRPCGRVWAVTQAEINACGRGTKDHDNVLTAQRSSFQLVQGTVTDEMALALGLGLGAVFTVRSGATLPAFASYDVVAIGPEDVEWTGANTCKARGLAGTLRLADLEACVLRAWQADSEEDYLRRAPRDLPFGPELALLVYGAAKGTDLGHFVSWRAGPGRPLEALVELIGRPEWQQVERAAAGSHLRQELADALAGAPAPEAREVGRQMQAAIRRESWLTGLAVLGVLALVGAFLLFLFCR